MVWELFAQMVAHVRRWMMLLIDETWTPYRSAIALVIPGLHSARICSISARVNFAFLDASSRSGFF